MRGQQINVNARHASCRRVLHTRSPPNWYNVRCRHMVNVGGHLFTPHFSPHNTRAAGRGISKVNSLHRHIARLQVVKVGRPKRVTRQASHQHDGNIGFQFIGRRPRRIATRRPHYTYGRCLARLHSFARLSTLHSATRTPNLVSRRMVVPSYKGFTSSGTAAQEGRRWRGYHFGR